MNAVGSAYIGIKSAGQAITIIGGIFIEALAILGATLLNPDIYLLNHLHIQRRQQQNAASANNNVAVGNNNAVQLAILPAAPARARANSDPLYNRQIEGSRFNAIPVIHAPINFIELAQQHREQTRSAVSQR